MRVLIIVALLHCALASTALESVVLMQSRLRGSKTSTSMEDRELHSAHRPNIFEETRYSDDDESCTTEGLSPGVCALSFLAQPRRTNGSDCESRERLERALVAEIEAGLSGNHSGFDAARIAVLQRELQPLYATLPHTLPLADIEGGLGLSSARYLLHQYFLRHHSWYVRGLNPAGDGRQPPDHKEALRSRVAGHLLELMERKVGAQGLNLKTLAVFVATLEHLLHGDERQRLKQSWNVHDLKQEDVTDAAGVQSVLEVFMAHFVYSSQKTDSGYALTLQKGLEEVKYLARAYDGWPTLQSAIRRELQQLHRDRDFNFEDAAKIGDQVLTYFRDVSGSMCRDMALTLAKMPGGERGAVPLAEMRKKDLFRESLAYLRAAKALDETEELVLVPNYMLSPSNCDGTTSFYDLCCPDPCEGQRAAFEEALLEGRDLELLALQQGASVVQSGKLRELKEISLHGQDFSMWLYKTFPSRCPRPDVLGKAVPDAHTEFQATAQESLFEW